MLSKCYQSAIKVLSKCYQFRYFAINFNKKIQKYVSHKCLYFPTSSNMCDICLWHFMDVVAFYAYFWMKCVTFVLYNVPLDFTNKKSVLSRLSSHLTSHLTSQSTSQSQVNCQVTSEVKTVCCNSKVRRPPSKTPQSKTPYKTP